MWVCVCVAFVSHSVRDEVYLRIHSLSLLPKVPIFHGKTEKKQILIIFRQWVMLAVAVCNASAEVMGLSTSSYTPNHTN